MEDRTPEVKRFNIESIPLVSLFLATDSQRRIRFSSDIIAMYRLRDVKDGATPRISLGYDQTAKAIAIKLAASPSDPTAANIDKRGYASASRFYHKTQLAEVPQRYTFVAEQDGWLVFTAE